MGVGSIGIVNQFSCEWGFQDVLGIIEVFFADYKGEDMVCFGSIGHRSIGIVGIGDMGCWEHRYRKGF